MGFLDLDQARAHCRVFDQEAEALLSLYLRAAESWIETLCGPQVVEDTPDDLRLAGYMLVAFWFEHRGDDETPPAPNAFNALIAAHRSFAHGPE